MRLYAEELSDLDPTEVLRAVRTYIRSEESPYPPTVGKLRARVKPDTGLMGAYRDASKLLASRSHEPSAGSMAETISLFGSKHVQHLARNDNAARTRVPGVVWAFPPRSEDCPCEECQAEFRDREGRPT